MICVDMDGNIEIREVKEFADALRAGNIGNWMYNMVWATGCELFWSVGLRQYILTLFNHTHNHKST